MLASALGACGGRASGTAGDEEGEGGRGETNVAGGRAGGDTGAGSQPGAGAAAGGEPGAGAAASGSAGATQAVPEPSSVTLLNPDGNVEGAAEPSLLGSCFRGFTTTVGKLKIVLDAFVQVPGDYMGDSIHLVMVSAYTNGREYHAGLQRPPFGETNLHVTSVSPRFVGSIDAKLYDSEDKDGVGPALELSLTFDVASPPGTCGR
jgi:hypothetical protein